MDNSFQRSSKPVAIWLMVGVGMIIVQVLLGGITRLTGSGLSITEWKPILGTIPPMNTRQWEEAFSQYKKIGQYSYLNAHFTLSDFKFIYFWEWFHRVWARLIGLAFLIPFVVFLIQKRFRKKMVMPMVILFLLGALQGLIGWIMVKSGLNNEDLYVDHIRLAIHFIAALGLLVYTFWFALLLTVPKQQMIDNASLRSITGIIIFVLVVQLVYGAFMAGLKAATYAPTWPMINGQWLPEGLNKMRGISNLTDNPIAVHFIHRSLALILVLLVVYWSIKRPNIDRSLLLNKSKWLPVFIILIQAILGILAVINSPKRELFLWFAVAHQFFGMLFLLLMVGMLYIFRRPAGISP